MKISNFVRNEDGSCDFEYSMNPEQAEEIMQHGLQDLILRGFIQIDTNEAAEEMRQYVDNGGSLS